MSKHYAYTLVLDYGDKVKSVPIIVKTPLDLMGRVSKLLDKFPQEKLSNVSLVNNGEARQRHYKRKVKEYKKSESEMITGGE